MSATSHLPALARRGALTPPATVREWPTDPREPAGMPATPATRRHLPAVVTGRWPSLVDDAGHGGRRWRPRLVTLAVLIVFGVLHVLTNDARTSVSDVTAATAQVAVSPSAMVPTAESATGPDEASGCTTSSWSACNLFTAPQVSSLLPLGIGVFAVAGVTQLAPLPGRSQGRDRACLSRVTLCISRT